MPIEFRRAIMILLIGVLVIGLTSCGYETELEHFTKNTLGVNTYSKIASSKDVSYDNGAYGFALSFSSKIEPKHYDYAYIMCVPKIISTDIELQDVIQPIMEVDPSDTYKPFKNSDAGNEVMIQGKYVKVYGQTNFTEYNTTNDKYTVYVYSLARRDLGYSLVGIITSNQTRTVLSEDERMMMAGSMQVEPGNPYYDEKYDGYMQAKEMGK